MILTIGTLLAVACYSGAQLYLQTETEVATESDEAQGVDVISISRTDGSLLGASDCEALVGFDGVLLAGRRSEPRQMPIAGAGGDFVLVVAATPSYLSVANPAIPDGTQVVAGGDLSARYGWAAGRLIDRDLRVSLVAGSARDPLLSEVVAAVVGPSSDLDLCWVELEGRDRALAEALASAASGPTSAATFTFAHDPDKRLDSLEELPFWSLVGATVVAAATVMTVVLIRRSSSAIFLTTGMKPIEVSVMRGAESAVFVLPAAVSSLVAAMAVGRYFHGQSLSGAVEAAWASTYVASAVLSMVLLFEFLVAKTLNPLHAFKWGL